MDPEEIKTLLDEQGKAFVAFKAATEELKKADVLTDEKVARIEKSLDAQIEMKAAIEKRMDAEKKEREDLELRLTRRGTSGGTGVSDEEVKSFNGVLSANAAKRGQSFAPLDAAGYDAYKSAFGSFMRKSAHQMTADEIKLLSVGVDADGGYFVTPDVGGAIVKKVFETSEIRSIASVQTIGTDALEGIEDLGEAGAGYAGEKAQSGDTTTPQVGKWRIEVHPIDTEPKATQQLLDDANVNIEAWLTAKVADKFARFENAEFVTGATKIRGFASYTTALDSGSGVTWGTIGHVMSGASAAFASTNPADYLFDLMGMLKQAYLPGARWVTRRSVITKIRKFKSADSQFLWQPGLTLGAPEQILGHPVTRAEDVATLAADSLSLWFGDFKAAYQIVDRQGIRVVRDALTSKPYVKFWTLKRTGGGVVNFEAIKAMKFNT